MSSSSSLTPDSGSELSELSDIESAELEKKILSKTKGSLDAWLQGSDGASSPPPPKRKREPSPPHDYVLADNPDIAFLVMFRARFASVFPRIVPNFGPQDIESSIVGSYPGEIAEKLLCALLGLVLNRKKDIGLGHYSRALEEAILNNRQQWPKFWEKNPVSGEGSFNNMTPEQRLNLLKTLALWALNTSDGIQSVIKDSYKQNRHEDDLNQPLSVQPWGRDGDKRRYWLVEGQDDTYFRLYRESNPALKTHTWWSVAGTIEDLRIFSTKLTGEGTQAAKRLSERIEIAIPRFEAGEEKRKRREYRIARKAQFRRPEPGFSLYEGRTRGKRIKYTFSDDEDGNSDAYSGRRSTRNATPAEPVGPTVTASGRQVRSRYGGVYGESLLSGQARQGGTSSDPLEAGAETDGGEAAVNGRTRSGRVSSGAHRAVNSDSDKESDAESSGNEWRGDDEEEDADDETDGDMDMDEDDNEVADMDGLDSSKSLVVKLKMNESSQTQPTSSVGTTTPVQTQLNGMQIATPPNKDLDQAAPSDPSQSSSSTADAVTAETPAVNGALLGGTRDPDHSTSSPSKTISVGLQKFPLDGATIASSSTGNGVVYKGEQEVRTPESVSQVFDSAATNGTTSTTMDTDSTPSKAVIAPTFTSSNTTSNATITIVNNNINSTNTTATLPEGKQAEIKESVSESSSAPAPTSTPAVAKSAAVISEIPTES